jgi:hypothetical protein
MPDMSGPTFEVRPQPLPGSSRTAADGRRVSHGMVLVFLDFLDDNG